MTTKKEAFEKFVWDDFPNWRHFVKDKCVGCGRFFDDPITNYAKFGNFCDRCNSKCNRKAYINLTEDIRQSMEWYNRP